MAKPWYQSFIEVFSKSGAYLLAGTALIENIIKGAHFITIGFAFIICISLVLFYVGLTILVRKRKLKWMTTDGEVRNVSAISKKQLYYFGLAVIIVWIVAIINLLSKNNDKIILSGARVNPAFDSADTRFKILVLPFNKECEGTSYDIGSVICRRLEELNVKDSLNLVTYYLEDSSIVKILTPNFVDSTRKANNADLIIFGQYSFRKCEGGNSDKICFNYSLDSDWGANIKYDTKMIDMSGLQSIRDGSGQEDIDHIVYIISSLQHYENGNFQKALEKIIKIKDWQNNITCLNIAAVCYIFSNRPEDAFESYRKIVSLDDNDKIALTNLGFFYMKFGAFDSSIFYSKKSLESNPKDEIALMNLASAYMSLGKYDEAKSFIFKSYQLNPNSYAIFRNVAVYYLGINEVDSSIRFLKDGLTKFVKKRADILYEIGDAYTHKGNTSEAETYLLQSLEIDSINVSAIRMLFLIYYGRSDFTNAIKMLESYLCIDSTNSRSWNSAGFLYLVVGDSVRARKALFNAVKFGLQKPDYLEVGRAYLLLEENANAEVFFLKSINEEGESEESLIGMARLSNIKGNKPRTIEYLKKGFAIAPNIIRQFVISERDSFKWLSENKELAHLLK